MSSSYVVMLDAIDDDHCLFKGEMNHPPAIHDFVRLDTPTRGDQVVDLMGFPSSDDDEENLWRVEGRTWVHVVKNEGDTFFLILMISHFVR
jgi:hypothetical protein